MAAIYNHFQMRRSRLKNIAICRVQRKGSRGDLDLEVADFGGFVGSSAEFLLEMGIVPLQHLQLGRNVATLNSIMNTSRGKKQ